VRVPHGKTRRSHIHAHDTQTCTEYKKRLAAKETLLDSLQSVATESSSTNVQKVAKKTLSRLQLSTK
jgi:hypothetical protein